MIHIDRFARYQTGLTLNQLFPAINGLCACGCGSSLSPRRRKWFSPECLEKAYLNFAVIKGDVPIIRQRLLEIDMGFCRSCGAYSNDWEADHIIPVFAGGGGCDISNFQTLCKECHAQKTYKLSQTQENFLTMQKIY